MSFALDFDQPLGWQLAETCAADREKRPKAVKLHFEAHRTTHGVALRTQGPKELGKLVATSKSLTYCFFGAPQSHRWQDSIPPLT